MYRLHGVHITNEHLIWNDRKEYYFVGPHSVFRDSQIDVAISARGWLLTKSQFINCTIRVKRELKNFSFCHAYLEGCRLLGRYHGCEFGRRLDDTDSPTYYPEAGIVDTDLSAATLNGCRFVTCDMSTLKLPRWPCFTMLDPEAVHEMALALPWPGTSRGIVEIWNNNPQGTVAVTWDARRVCREDGCTEAELKAVVEQIPGVIL